MYFSFRAYDCGGKSSYPRHLRIDYIVVIITQASNRWNTSRELRKCACAVFTPRLGHLHTPTETIQNLMSHFPLLLELCFALTNTLTHISWIVTLDNICLMFVWQLSTFITLRWMSACLCRYHVTTSQKINTLKQ